MNSDLDVLAQDCTHNELVTNNSMIAILMKTPLNKLKFFNDSFVVYFVNLLFLSKPSHLLWSAVQAITDFLVKGKKTQICNEIHYDLFKKSRLASGLH